MNTHSPGPWAQGESGGHHVVDLPDGRIAAFCGLVDARDNDESLANARLMAAAPSMLTALRMVWMCIDRVNHPAALAVRAAIEQAEGT